MSVIIYDRHYTTNKCNLIRFIFRSRPNTTETIVSKLRQQVLGSSTLIGLYTTVQLDNFVHEHIELIRTAQSKPEKFTDTRGMRRFTLVPLYGLQKRHVQFDKQSFPKLLRDTLNIRGHNPSTIDDAILVGLYYGIFKFYKVNFGIEASLLNGNRRFCNFIRTDGYDVEFICSDIRGAPIIEEENIKTSMDINAKIDIRNATATKRRNMHAIDNSDAVRVLSQMSTLKTVDPTNFITSVRYVLQNYTIITGYLEHRTLRKSKWKAHVSKQKGLREICDRLLCSSIKYISLVENERVSRPNKWTSFNPSDHVAEHNRPIVIAYGNADF
ncbi:MAG: hypothetical protein EXX96DRAFT_538736 [Benjaminiella poitrasii]|nr:MAG: hypothetical protein EXX96DRAFT_538736 [Benjaminiella poitrasii]